MRNWQESKFLDKIFATSGEDGDLREMGEELNPITSPCSLVCATKIRAFWMLLQTLA
jgi:hypothetical protein